MEVYKNHSPSFSGIQIYTSKMNRVQQNLSRVVSDMLDYSDEYVKVADNVDVYFLPGKTEKSVIVKFMDRFSDMFFKKDAKTHVQSSVNPKMNLETFVDGLKVKLKNISDGKYDLPDYDEAKFLNSETDLAKLKPDVYEEAFESMDDLEALMGDKTIAKQLALDEYNQLKRIHLDDPEF